MPWLEDKGLRLNDKDENATFKYFCGFEETALALQTLFSWCQASSKEEMSFLPSAFLFLGPMSLRIEAGYVPAAGYSKLIGV